MNDAQENAGLRRDVESIPAGLLAWRFGDRHDGDASIDHPNSALASVAPLASRLVTARQVHGVDVRIVEAGDHDPVGLVDADAVVTAAVGVAAGIRTADCVPVLLSSPEGVVGAAHAGWRGLQAGVLDHAAAAMRRLGASTVEARVGPHIHVECYEFQPEDLGPLASRFGDDVVGRSSRGHPALDLVVAVRHAADRADVEIIAEDPRCTACDEDFFSHRARRESGRQLSAIARVDG